MNGRTDGRPQNSHFAFLSLFLGLRWQRALFILGSLESPLVDFLFVLIILFSLDVTAEALREDID